MQKSYKIVYNFGISERNSVTKLYTILAFLSAIGLQNTYNFDVSECNRVTKLYTILVFLSAIGLQNCLQFWNF